MALSTNGKPEKPYKDFPLFAHNNGQWAKKILGKLHYFGLWADPSAALEKYHAEKDYLLAGKEPPRHPQEGVVTVGDLCEQFLESKSHQLDAGELSPRSYQDYFRTCKAVGKILGKDSQVPSLSPSDFAELRRAVAKNRSPGSVKNELVRIRVIFNWGEKSDLIAAVKYGPDFASPSKKQLRQQRQQSTKRFFTPQQIRAFIKYSDVHLRAMILLGINCGWGNNDIASVPLTAISLTNGWADFPRPKTAIERCAPLWPETVSALRESLARRHAPLPEADGLFFVTKYGDRYVRQRDGGAWVDSVGLIFGKLLKRLKVKRKGINFYSLRHTFRTIADEVGDAPAVDRIMGHETPGIGTAYREWTRDQREADRLARVTDHVHGWLYARLAKSPVSR